MIPYIDQIFAQHCTQNEALRPLFNALMAASREGHLCLDLEDPLTTQEVRSAAAQFESHPLVIRFGQRFYLKKLWLYETAIIQELERLMKPLAPIAYISENLNSDQQAAVVLALSHPLSIITGGPGTGKTHVAKEIAKALGANARVVLTAPTGKAAARLRSVDPSAATLHSLLSIRSEKDFAKGSGYLKADLLIVDESSMIDAKLFAYLLASIQSGTRIVFLGDGNQLPPVESGNLFADLVGLVPTAYLTQSMRTDRKEVLSLAQNILDGHLEHFEADIDVIELAKTYFPGPTLEFLDLGSDQECFRFLSCVREGPWGVDPLNEQIAAHFRKLQKPHEFLAIPILIAKNDYKKDLYNGETAVLISSYVKPLYSIFSSGRKVDAALLPPYEYAYCLSVHKSQGSEYDNIVVFVPPGSEVFGREVLYTAVTRARHSVRVIGNKETIEKTINARSRKASGVRERLFKL